MKRFYKALLAALALAMVVAAAWSIGPLTAQQRSEVGYIDWEFVVNAYWQVEIDMVLEERDRLQEEFNRESADLDEDAKLELFAEYEARLDAFEQEVFVDAEQRMKEIETALAEAAVEAGVSVVVDHGAVVWGGVDLTEPVMRRLGLID